MLETARKCQKKKKIIETAKINVRKCNKMSENAHKYKKIQCYTENIK